MFRGVRHAIQTSGLQVIRSKVKKFMFLRPPYIGRCLGPTVNAINPKISERATYNILPYLPLFQIVASSATPVDKACI